MAGIEAMEHFILQRDPNELPSSACIMTLAEIVFPRNYFMFQNNFFIQMKGTAMGSPMAPNYANMYVRYMKKQSILNPLKNDLDTVHWWYFSSMEGWCRTDLGVPCFS